MHIILTANYSPWSAYSGGGQSSTHNLASALSKRGHEVEVVFTKTPFETIRTPSDLPYTLHWALHPGIKSRRASWLRNFSTFSVRRKVKKLLRDKSIIHSNGEEGALIPSLKNGKKIKFVSTPRDSHISKSVKEPLPSFGKSFLRLKKTKYYLLGKAIKGADLCSPTSDYALQLLKHHYDFKQVKVKVIPNGVNGNFLQTKLKKKFNSSLIYFGRLDASKGADIIIEAINLINDNNITLTIIGRGDLEAKLKAQVEKLGLTEQIKFKPWMSTQDLVSCLEKASFAVLPSKKESFGNTMAEAMATGTPVISTTGGSIPEVVLHGKTGLLIPPGDVNALAAAIKKLMNNPAMSHQLAKNARERVRKNFTWAAVAQQFESQYEELLRMR